MTIYDAAMAGAILLGLGWGAWRGITWQLASLASLFLGYGASHTLSSQLAPSFPGEPLVARGLAMITIYLVTSCGIFLLAWIVRTTLARLKFEAFDRHLGMVLGGMEGAMLGVIVTLFVVSIAPETREPIFHSYSGRLVGALMDNLGPALPPEARSILGPFWKGEDGVPSNAPIKQLAQAEPAAIPATRPARSWNPFRDKDVKPASDELIDETRKAIGDAKDAATGQLLDATKKAFGDAKDSVADELIGATKKSIGEGRGGAVGRAGRAFAGQMIDALRGSEKEEADGGTGNAKRR
ncbi:CvpA family protein [Isosphaeraceae bacterium EP7]